MQLLLSRNWPFLFGLFLGLTFTVSSFIGFDFSSFPGDLGDARFNNYLLEHCHKFFIGEHDSFWNAPFLYPEENIITYSDNLVGTAPLYSIFRLLNFSMISAFQLWIISLFILNYYCAYAFFRWLLKNRYSAVIGAFIFAFSIGLHSQISNVQTFPRLFVPLAIWCALLFIKNCEIKYFFGALAMLVLQFYSGIYLGFLLSIPIAVILFSGFVVNRKRLFTDSIINLKWFLYFFISLFIVCTLLGILMYPYYIHAKSVKPHTFEFVSASIPTIQSYFYSKPGSFIWSSLSSHGIGTFSNQSQHQLFVGIVPIISLGFIITSCFLRNKWIGLKNLISNKILVLLITFLILFLIFLKIGNFSLYSIIYVLPGYGAMRDIGRIINIELLFFGMTTGLAFSIITSRFNKFNALIFSLFLVFITLENYVTPNKVSKTDKDLAEGRMDYLLEKMKNIPKGSIISYEPPKMYKPPLVYQLDAMISAQELGLISINGYSALAPANYDGYWQHPNEYTRNIWLKTKATIPETIYVIK